MDPNTALAEIRELVAESYREALTEDETSRLCDLIEGLDRWVTRGGFLPAAWTVTRS